MPGHGDLNNDGIPDLLVPTTGDTVVAYLGNGNGTFTEKSTTPVDTAGFGGDIALGDFNHDGNLGFATAGNQMAFGNGDGTFRTLSPIWPSAPDTGFTNVATGDLNGDGWDDIVLTNLFNGDIYVLLNNQQGGFVETTIEPAPFSFDSSAQTVLADLRGNGILDAVVDQATIGGVAVYVNDGTGKFTLGQTLADVTNTPGPIVVSDVNGDGIPDICLSETGTVAVFLGEGGGKFAPIPIYIGAGPDPTDILTMNLHGQSPNAGVPDLVLPDHSGGVTVLINTTK